MQLFSCNAIYRYSFVFYLFIVSVSNGQNISISIISENSNTVGLYEKYEIVISLSGIQYSNPYDPDQIDVTAEFNSPSGKVFNVFGFYDNYNARDQWKVRFSPNEKGEWNYDLYLKNNNDSAASSNYTFQAIESDYNGWLKVSNNNPHYFVHDNGSSYYGVGPFYPWGVNNGSTGLDLLEKSGGNFFGYWNIMYGGEGRIIESLESGLGKYDQPKCGRIDQIMNWAENRNLKVMLSIWPHDLLAGDGLEGTGWVTQWDQNPYNTITTATNFYESEEAWEYQEKQYRYLIARYGYSRSLGIWEMVNEINGTDGWVAGKYTEVLNWVKRVYNYFKSNDTYNHPVTVSQSGGIYWPAGYAETDVPNVHLYETGWSQEYPGNPLRSSHYIYNKISRDFWNDFEKPAILGEAGYLGTYGNFAVPSSNYTQLYHNALYSSWAGGLAVTPIWWSFESKSIMNNDVMNQMKAFSKVAKMIEYDKYNLNPYLSYGENCDVYTMGSDSLLFGWLREERGQNPSGNSIYFEGVIDTSYIARWIDSWSGEEIFTSISLGVNNSLNFEVPEPPENKPDLAFIVNPIGEGGEAFELTLTAAQKELLASELFTTTITCMVRDESGLISKDPDRFVEFSLEGPGKLLGENFVLAGDGYVSIEYQAGNEVGNGIIIANSQDLLSDTISINLTDRLIVDNFENYNSLEDLNIKWNIRAGTTGQFYLDKTYIGDGSQSLRFHYRIGNGSPPDVGFNSRLTEKFIGTNLLEFWLKPDGSNRNLALLLFENTKYWRYDIIFNGSEPQYFSVPINEFVPQNTDSEVDLDSLTKISFNIFKGSGDWGDGVIYLDGLAFVTDDISSAQFASDHSVPQYYELYQNYPNPFNVSTNIDYYLPEESNVKIEVFDVLGQRISTILNARKQPGKHSLVFNGNNLASGFYLLTFKAGEYFKTKKITLLK